MTRWHDVIMGLWTASDHIFTSALQPPTPLITSIHCFWSQKLLMLSRIIPVYWHITLHGMVCGSRFLSDPLFGTASRGKAAVLLDFVQMRGGGSPNFLLPFLKCIFGQQKESISSKMSIIWALYCLFRLYIHIVYYIVISIFSPKLTFKSWILTSEKSFTSCPNGGGGVCGGRAR